MPADYLITAHQFQESHSYHIKILSLSTSQVARGKIRHDRFSREQLLFHCARNTINQPVGKWKVLDQMHLHILIDKRL